MSELISGTQLAQWKRCERLYHYAHDERIAPRELPWPIALGRAGHDVLASYYNGLQLGLSHADAMAEARSTASWNADVAGGNPKAIGYVLPLVDQYWAKYAADPARWLVLAVEREVRVAQLGWTYVATIDLLVSSVDGGPPQLWDHRFLWDFYTAEMARLDPQLPQYAVAARRTIDPAITGAVRNMVSTAPPAQLAKANRNRVKRVELQLTEARLMLVERDMQRTAQQILAWRAMDLGTRALLATRTVVAGERYPACSTCPFFKLCTAEAWGEHDRAAEIRATEFVASDYGYQEVQDG